MSCSCIYVDSESNCDFINNKIITAKKEHECTECKRIIKPKERYEYVSGMWDGDFDVFKTCSDCLSIREAFFCDSYIFTQVLEMVEEMLGEENGNIDPDCIVSLTTKAKEWIFEKIEDIWNELEEREKDEKISKN